MRPSITLRRSWSGFRQRSHPIAARFAIVAACGFAVLYGWPLGTVLLRLYFPEPGRYCGTAEVLALVAGAVVVAPAALLFSAAQVLARRSIRARPVWRAAASVAFVSLLALVLANWLALAKLLWP